MVKCLLKSKCRESFMDKVWVGNILVLDSPTWFELTDEQFEDVKNGRGAHWVDVLEVKVTPSIEEGNQDEFDARMPSEEVKRSVGRPKKS